MEIKSIEKHIEVNYPKQNEISNKKLKKSIPKKWSKLGITSFVFSLLLKEQAYAVSTNNVEIMGFLPTNSPAPVPQLHYMQIICTPLSIIFGIAVLINLILIIRFKLKAKKENKKIKLPKKLKISLIISIIVLIMSLIGLLIALATSGELEEILSEIEKFFMLLFIPKI